MFVLTKNIFIGLLIAIVNVSNHKNVYCWAIKYVSFNLLLLIYILMNNEYSQEFHY